jgi:hypothetical protein
VLSTEGPVRAELIRDGDAVGTRLGGAEVMFKGPAGGALRIGEDEYALTVEVKRGAYE